MANLNPMQLNGPSWTPNHIQNDYRNPPANPAVAAAPVGAANPMNLVWPIAPYVQPGYSK